MATPSSTEIFDLKDPLSSLLARYFGRYSQNVTEYINKKMPEFDRRGLLTGKATRNTIEAYENEIQKYVDYFRKEESIQAHGASTSKRYPTVEEAKDMDAVFKKISEDLGITGKEILAKLQAQKKKAAQSASHQPSPFTWNKFNQLNAKLTANTPPPNLHEAFREMLISKAQENEKQYDEGTLDPSRIAEYWKGDIFSLPIEEKRTKVRVYVYRDFSGSMDEVLGLHIVEAEDKATAEKVQASGTMDLTKTKIIDEIFVALFETLYEAQDLGLPIRFFLGYWDTSLVILKDIDQEMTLQQLQQEMANHPNDGGTNIQEVVRHYVKIEPDAQEKVIVIVLSDGDLGASNDFNLDGSDVHPSSRMSGYDLIKRHPTGHIHLWFPIGFKPNANAKEIFGDYQTHTRIDVYQAIMGALQRVLDQIYR